MGKRPPPDDLTRDERRGKVIPLPLPKRGKRGMPERWSDEELRKLLTNAMRDGFTLEQVRYAEQAVRLWAETNQRQRTRWHLVVLNALRQGWGLRGFRAWLERHGQPRQTALTEARIREIVATRGGGW